MSRTFAEVLCAAIDDSRVSTAQLAGRVGLSISGLRKYCSGKRLPEKLEVMEGLAAALGLSAREREELMRIWRRERIGAGDWRRQEQILALIRSFDGQYPTEGLLTEGEGAPGASALASSAPSAGGLAVGAVASLVPSAGAVSSSPAPLQTLRGREAVQAALLSLIEECEGTLDLVLPSSQETVLRAIAGRCLRDPGFCVRQLVFLQQGDLLGTDAANIRTMRELLFYVTVTQRWETAYRYEKTDELWQESAGDSAGEEVGSESESESGSETGAAARKEEAAGRESGEETAEAISPGAGLFGALLPGSSCVAITATAVMVMDRGLSRAMIIREGEVCALYARRFSQIYAQSRSFLKVVSDPARSMYLCQDTRHSEAGVYQLMPMMEMYAPEEAVDRIVRQDVPQRGYLVSTFLGYRRMMRSRQMPQMRRVICSPSGIERFLESGLQEAYPREYCNPMPLQQRRQALRGFLLDLVRDPGRYLFLRQEWSAPEQALCVYAMGDLLTLDYLLPPQVSGAATHRLVRVDVEEYSIVHSFSAFFEKPDERWFYGQEEGQRVLGEVLCRQGMGALVREFASKLPGFSLALEELQEGGEE